MPLLTLVAGVLPAAVAWIGKLIVDGVVAAMAQHKLTGSADTSYVLLFVAAEAGVVALIAGSQRGIATCQALLRALMGQRINLMILEKALTLKLAHFEDSEFYDKLTRARREASTRPLSLVTRTFGLVQNAISLVSYGVLLVQFSPWTVLILLGGGIPEFLAEAKFSGDKFRLFRWRSPETRMQMYLETVLAREDYAKEVKLFRLGPKLLERYREIFAKLFAEDRALTLRRDSWGFALGLIGTAAFYGAYAWIAVSAIRGAISLGQMTMYLLLFKQGQSAVSASLSAISGMYEDNLYLSNLYEYLEQEVAPPLGKLQQGPQPGDGVRFEAVSFAYPGSEEPALQRGEPAPEAGGQPGAGRRERLGQDHPDQAADPPLPARCRAHPARRPRSAAVGIRRPALPHRRHLPGFRPLPVFGRGEHRRRRHAPLRGPAALGGGGGKGDGPGFHRQTAAAVRHPARQVVQGRRELSGGQWQKIALARAFMRTNADILVLDEPTATMDAAAEATVFEHFRELSRGKMTILISHRFSTVRMADQIVVLDRGRIVEQGSHEQLMELGGQYAHLFSLQAQGYR